MKNAELYFHIEHLAKNSILPEIEKRQDAVRKVNVSPHHTIQLVQLETHPESGVIEVQLEITALDHVSNYIIEKAFNSIIKGVNFDSLLPDQLKAFQFDKSSIHCDSSKLDEMCKEARSYQEYDQYEVWVGYKHSLIYKLPPKGEKDLLKVIKADLQSRKKLAAKEKHTFSAMTSINFEFEHRGKVHHCSLNPLTQKLGFANSYDENGNKLAAHSLTWDAWRTPTADLSDLFKGVHTNTALKAVLKSHLVKGAKITSLTTTRFKFVDYYSFYRSYKLIRMYANIGDYHNPVLAIVDIHKSGEIVILNERNIDITTTDDRAKSMVNQLQAVHKELFCSNKHYAKSILTFHHLSVYHRVFS